MVVFFKQKNSWILTDFFHFLFFYIIFHIQIKCIDLLSKNPYIFSTASNSLQEFPNILIPARLNKILGNAGMLFI